MVSWHVSAINTWKTCNSSLFLVLLYIHLHTCFDPFLPFFRKKFSRLGEVGSLIPPHVHMITLTGIATVSTQDKVITTLEMVDPYILAISPTNQTLHIVLLKRNYFCSVDWWITKKTTPHAQSYHLLSKIRRLCSTLRNFVDCTRQGIYWASWSPKCDVISTCKHYS